jgi:hypothetical protein
LYIERGDSVNFGDEVDRVEKLDNTRDEKTREAEIDL